MKFSRQEYWNGLPFPPLGDLPHPGIETRCPGLQADSLLSQSSYWAVEERALKQGGREAFESKETACKGRFDKAFLPSMQACQAF